MGTGRVVGGQEPGITESEIRHSLQALDPLWDELFPAEQARLVHLLVERVDIGEDALDIRLRADGLPGLAREFGMERKAA